MAAEFGAGGMQRVRPASGNVFRLRFYNDNKSGDLALETSGRVAIIAGEIVLNFTGEPLVIGWRASPGFVVRTMCRNSIPLYVRSRGGEIWISNDIAELAVEGETLSVRAVELISAVMSPSAIKSVAAHLLEGITLLLPASLYEIGLDASGNVRCIWKDVVFEDIPNSRDEFLEFLIEKYRDAFAGSDLVCLALSGGYDSRFELALLAHLNKKVHCFHFERICRERQLAAKVARVCGAPFHTIPIDEASRQGWMLLHGRGYTTRWDGYFSAGAIPSAGVYAEMERVHPSAAKQLLVTGTLRGRLYDKAEHVFDHWRGAEHNALAQLAPAFPEFRYSIEAERERRCEALAALEDKIRAKTDRTDIVTDMAYHFHYRSVGRVATRSTFLIENGMPAILANQIVRDRFAALPVEHKRGEAFLEWVTRKLNPPLADLPWISSSERALVRQFGTMTRWPLARELLKRYRAPDIGNLTNWVSESDSDSILRQLPELRHVAAQARDGNPNLYISMILQFLHTLQARKNVSYRVC